MTGVMRYVRPGGTRKQKRAWSSMAAVSAMLLLLALLLLALSMLARLTLRACCLKCASIHSRRPQMLALVTLMSGSVWAEGVTATRESEVNA
jgi:hypothetical protein